MYGTTRAGVETRPRFSRGRLLIWALGGRNLVRRCGGNGGLGRTSDRWKFASAAVIENNGDGQCRRDLVDTLLSHILGRNGALSALPVSTSARLVIRASAERYAERPATDDDATGTLKGKSSSRSSPHGRRHQSLANTFAQYPADSNAHSFGAASSSQRWKRAGR